MASFWKKKLKILSGTESQKMAWKCKLHTAAPPRHASWWKIASAPVQSTYQGWSQTGCQSFFPMSHRLTADWSFNARFIFWRKDLEFTRSVLKKSRLEKVSVTQVNWDSVFYCECQLYVHTRSEKFENTTLFLRFGLSSAIHTILPCPSNRTKNAGFSFRKHFGVVSYLWRRTSL